VLLERHGDDVLRDAIAQTVERGQLSVAGVRRRLPSSARVSDGDSRRSRVVQPRGRKSHQLPLPLRRADRKRGDT
jgi:hypothetical protein